MSVRKTVDCFSKVWELFSGEFKPIRHRVGMEWISDCNPEAMASGPFTALILVMNPDMFQILDELGMTLLAADLIQMLHQSTARFTDFRLSP